jgi:hypothetical protein
MGLEITLEKYDIENKVLFNFDFTEHPNIVAGQTLSGTASIAVTPPGEVTVGAPVIGSSNKIVQAEFSGGLADKTYIVRCDSPTSQSGALVTVCGKLRVKGC